jgi:AraC-like DNA-binding protein
MALAKNLLRRKEGSVAEIAERVGYSSPSTFIVAFTRYVIRPPTWPARGQTESYARSPIPRTHTGGEVTKAGHLLPLFQIL